VSERKNVTAGGGVNLREIKLLSFDCYGTLIDWEAGILDGLRAFREENSIPASDDELLERYGRIESNIQAGPYKPYRGILVEVMRGLAAAYGVEESRYGEDVLVRSLPDWRPFEDTVASLRALRTRYRLAIVSNIDDDLFEHSARHLEVEFDHVVTAQQVGAYKPSHENFEYAETIFGVPKENWLHVAQSLYHDIAPANELGIMCAWINRRHAKPGAGATRSSSARPTLEFPDMASFTRSMPRA